MNENVSVLALDLEGTLISNAMSQIPRPGLGEFLEHVYTLFERVVLYTTVSEQKARGIAHQLVSEGAAPAWLEQIEYVSWPGTTKDLSLIPGIHWRNALLVDDYEAYVHPGQKSQWVEIEQFGYPYPDHDRQLVVALTEIEERLGLGSAGSRLADDNT